MRLKKDETSEKWLSELDKSIWESVKLLVKRSWEDLPDSREEWIMGCRSQVAQTVSLIRWTEDVEDFLADDTPTASLALMIDELNGYVRTLAE